MNEWQVSEARCGGLDLQTESPCANAKGTDPCLGRDIKPRALAQSSRADKG